MDIYIKFTLWLTDLEVPNLPEKNKPTCYKHVNSNIQIVGA